MDLLPAETGGKAVPPAGGTAGLQPLLGPLSQLGLLQLRRPHQLPSLPGVLHQRLSADEVHHLPGTALSHCRLCPADALQLGDGADGKENGHQVEKSHCQAKLRIFSKQQ